MKAQVHRIEDAQDSLLEADLEATVRILFCRRPMLCGFAVSDAPNDKLRVTEVNIYPWSALGAPAELCDEIVATLLDLIDECPGTRGLLGGRTFARTFH
jgi:hypothetical protein